MFLDPKQQLMQDCESKDTSTLSAIDREFEKVKQWMTYQEIENYLHRNDKPGILLSMILDRYQTNRKLISLLKTEINIKFTERLSRLDESLQVSHFLYQATLVDMHEVHRTYMKKISRLINDIQNNHKR